VDHTRYKFASLLRFAEMELGLPSLTARDANANPPVNAFDFTQTPRPPLVLYERDCLVDAGTPGASQPGG
jgi:hypothetical protein